MSVIDDIKFKALFETLYFCGLRRGELRGLSWDNINFEDKTLSIVKNVTNMCGDHGYWQITTPKTRTSTRTLPIPDILVNDLKKLKEYNMKHQYQFTQKYFVFGDINPIHPDVLRRNKNDIAQKAGIKQIRIHDFRHSCASLLINNGASIMIVAKYLGHAKIDETLNTYSHLFKNKMDEIVDLMNKMNS
ncbi:MAG: site-specific integrase [bacterium]|nr:site-specific integrase [bacterium]